MSDANEFQVLPQAAARRSRRVSAIWSIPIVAVAIAAWLVWDTLSKEGPTIEITFESAEGLESGKSQLKYKDIVFGTVKQLRLTPDNSQVVVSIATTAQAEPLLTDGTVFWVVKPRLFAGNISGLETVLSGNYVGMLPATKPGKEQRQFTGQKDPPILGAHVPGRTFLLKSKRIGSVSVGSPIFFRDLSVGEVLGWDIADMAESVTIHAFVRAPYDSYVDDQTRFWNASGLSIKLGSAGIELQMESLRAVILGGIAFGTPANATGKKAVAENHVFPLFADQEQADASSYSRKVTAVSYFPGSVRGLGRGSEVTMHGLKIGEVTDVRIAYDAATDAIVAPVRYEVQPERIVGIGQRVFKTEQEAVEAMLKKGLRASAQSVSLITGQQAVALDFVTDAPPAELKMLGEDFLIPSTDGGGFAGLASSAGELLDKVNTIPFTSIGKSLDGLLRSADAIANGQELKASLTHLAATLASAQDLVQHLDKGLTPASRRLPELAAELQRAVVNANKLLLSVDAGYGDGTRFNRDLDRLMIEFTGAARSIRSLADLLQRHPEALIKGRSAGSTQ